MRWRFDTAEHTIVAGVGKVSARAATSDWTKLPERAGASHYAHGHGSVSVRTGGSAWRALLLWCVTRSRGGTARGGEGAVAVYPRHPRDPALHPRSRRSHAARSTR